MHVWIAAAIVPEGSTSVLSVETELSHSANNAGAFVPTFANDVFDHFYG
jgi:hypothetical protein